MKRANSCPRSDPHADFCLSEAFPPNPHTFQFSNPLPSFYCPRRSHGDASCTISLITVSPLTPLPIFRVARSRRRLPGYLGTGVDPCQQHPTGLDRTRNPSGPRSSSTSNPSGDGVSWTLCKWESSHMCVFTKTVGVL